SLRRKSMSEIHDSGPDTGPITPTPREQKMYEQEYKHGADLFQRALEEHAKSTNIYQQKEFKEVMDKALNVLNETAKELKQKQLENQNQQIVKDYDAYQTDHSEAAKK